MNTNLLKESHNFLLHHLDNEYFFKVVTTFHQNTLVAWELKNIYFCLLSWWNSKKIILVFGQWTYCKWNLKQT